MRVCTRSVLALVSTGKIGQTVARLFGSLSPCRCWCRAPLTLSLPCFLSSIGQMLRPNEGKEEKRENTDFEDDSALLGNQSDDSEEDSGPGASSGSSAKKGCPIDLLLVAVLRCPCVVSFAPVLIDTVYADVFTLF